MADVQETELLDYEEEEAQVEAGEAAEGEQRMSNEWMACLVGGIMCNSSCL